MFIALKTNTPEAEVLLLTHTQVLSSKKWLAHKELSATLHSVIQSELQAQGVTLQQVQGIVCYNEGGSFTGLRIGISVANAIAAALRVPVVGCTAKQWQQPQALALLLTSAKKQNYIQPLYDRPATITQPKK